MNDTIIFILLGILIFMCVVVVIFGFSLGSSFISQTIEKKTFGGFRYKITVDNSWYATNDYQIDENGCINFIDNYNQTWKWCEKYSVGEYYFHTNKPTLKTIWFGI